MRKPVLIAGAMVALILGGAGAVATPSLALAAPPPAASSPAARSIEADALGVSARVDAASDAADVAYAAALAETELTAGLEAAQAFAARAGRAPGGAIRGDAVLAATGRPGAAPPSMSAPLAVAAVPSRAADKPPAGVVLCLSGRALPGFGGRATGPNPVLG